MRKILFLASGLGVGGVATALMSLIRVLEKAGYECKIIEPYAEMQSEELVLIPSRYYLGSVWRHPIRNKYLKILVKIFNIVSCNKFVFMFGKRYSADIFVVYQALGNSYWRNYSKCPMIGWIHGAHSSVKSIFNRINLWDERRNLDKFNRLVAVSDQTAAQWQNLLQLKVSPLSIPNLIDLDDMVKRGNEKQAEIYQSSVPNLLFCGRLFVEKGILRLLHIAARLYAEGERFMLWIVGIGRVEKEVKDFVLRSGLSSVVKFLGFKSNPFPYYKACDLLINASYTEGYPTTFREALVQHCAVVATDVGGCRQALNDGEWGRVIEDSDEAIYDFLKKYLCDPSIANPTKGFDSAVNDICMLNVANKEATLQFFKSFC